MAQTTFQSLASGLSGLAFRNNTNTILAALFSANSGPSAPSPTVGGQFWLDTGVTPAVMRVRNAANSAWQVVLPETIAAETVWGNESGSAASPAAMTIPALRALLGFPQGGAGRGEWRRTFHAASTTVSLPSGSTWAYFWIRRNTSTGAVIQIDASVNAGGTTLLTLGAGEDVNMLVWRVGS